VTPWGVTMVKAPTIWPTTQGQGVKLLVIDGSSHASHPDLPVGFNCYSWCVDDGSGHGSGVLGTIVALNNSYGTVGVAPGVTPAQIHAKAVCFYNASIPGGGDLKFPGVAGSSECLRSNVAQELNWAAANLLPRGIVNMSFGWSSVNISFGMAQAAATAFWNGVLLVAGAGNLPSTDPPAGGVLYPAAYSHVIGVSGVAPDSNLASTCTTSAGFGSNYGSHVELAAPFESWAVHPPTLNNGAYYDNACGTSIAAPMVAGVAALVWSYRPSWSNQRLREHLIASAIDRGATGWDANTGFGLVQATLTDVFAPPTLTGTTTGNPKRPRLTWNAVPAAGSYQIYRKVTPFSPDWELWTTTTGTAYTDAATNVSSFYGYDSVPSGTSVSYYVTAVTPSGYQSILYSRYASFVAVGTPPY
jgi:serine protease